MSIADLKSRLADVPGIDALNMKLEAGKILLQWGAGYAATVNAAASDHEIEVAVREAIKLPPVTTIPEKQAGVTVPSASPAQPSEGAKVSAATASTAATHLNIQQMMERHGGVLAEMQQAALAAVQVALDRQATAVLSSGTNLASKIDGQTDDFLAMMGQYSNSIG